MIAVEMDGIKKNFGNVTALNNMDLTVNTGEIVGLVGPNGSGKSTMIDLMLGYIHPTEGTVKLFGRNITDKETVPRDRLSAVPDRYSVYERHSGIEHVEFVSSLRGVDVNPRRELERVGLAESGDQPAGTYSHGMVQRLVLGLALIGDPDLLVFDEPFTGIDPKGIVMIQNIIRETTDQNTAVVLSSHHLDHLSIICDYIMGLRNNELETIKNTAVSRDDQVILEIDIDITSDRVLSAVRDCDGVIQVSYGNENLEIVCNRSSQLPILGILESNNVSVDAFDIATFTTDETVGDSTSEDNL